MDSVKDIVLSVIGKLSVQRGPDVGKIQELWPGLIADKAKTHTRVGGARGDQVVVYVDTPAWLYEMNLERERILTAIRQDFPEIQKIIFKIGKVKG